MSFEPICVSRQLSREAQTGPKFVDQKKTTLGVRGKIFFDIQRAKRKIFQNIYRFMLGILFLHMEIQARKWPIFKNLRIKYRQFSLSTDHF